MDKLKEHSAKTQNATVALTVEKLLEHLKSRPGVASHILTMLECGAYDEVDRPQDSGDFLPRSCNKFNLLSREAVMGLMGFLMPSYKEWFGGLPKTSKKECVLALCFLVHVAPDSALPTKSVTGLQEWCKQRYEQYGSRLGLRGDAPGRDQRSLREWFDDHGCSFWSVSAQSQTIKFVCGDSAPLPEELKKLGVDTLVIENGLEVYNATIGCGCLKIKIADLFDVKTLDMPWWRKEVLLQESQETPGTPTTTTTASATTPRSTPAASPTNNGSVPPPEGNGHDFVRDLTNMLGEMEGWAAQRGGPADFWGEVSWQGFPTLPSWQGFPTLCRWQCFKKKQAQSSQMSSCELCTFLPGLQAWCKQQWTCCLLIAMISRYYGNYVKVHWFPWPVAGHLHVVSFCGLHV